MISKVFAAFLAVFLLPTTALSAIIPAGLSPGDSYHLVFVTNGTRTAQSSNISDYNSWVQGEAALNSSLTGTDDGTQWRAIGSTFMDKARDNALVSAPVYLLDGLTEVATGFVDLWDGTINAPINIDQFGTSVIGVVSVHTGSNDSGFPQSISPPRYLGSTQTVGTGRTDLLTSNWVNDGAGLNDTLRPLFALSEQLTVPPVPEPSTLAIGLLACCGWGIMRLRSNRA